MSGSRVKLKNHVYFGIVADGVLFDAGDATFVLKDKSTYPLIEKLIALIDAGNPVESILEHAPGKLAEFFRRILSSLAEHGMLMEVEADAPSAEQLVTHTASNELRKFLEDRLGGRSVEPALARWHSAQVVVVGAGHALLSAVRALSDSGCMMLTVVADGGPVEGLSELLDEIERSRALRFDMRTTLDDLPDMEAAGLLVYASDAAVMALVDRIEEVMRAQAMTGAIGSVFDGRACVMPASRPGRPGVKDLLHWLPQQDADTASLGPVAMALLGCVVAQAAMTRFFGIEATASGGQVTIVAPDLSVEQHMLVASAKGDGVPVPFVYPSKYQMPDGWTLLPFEQVKLVLEPWFDPLLGPLSVAADDEIEQVPLMLYPIRVRSASAVGKEWIAVGWGLEHAEAVVHGLEQAIEALARTFRQGTDAIVCAFDEARWKRRALAYAIAASPEMAERHHWAWVDPERLPPGSARVMHTLLRFHAGRSIRTQMQWSDCDDAYIVRMLDDSGTLCSVVAADPLAALEEGFGKACSLFQLKHVHADRYDPELDLPPPGDAAQVADWHEALRPVQATSARHAEYHLLAGPGFPPLVYCGHATLKAMTDLP